LLKLEILYQDPYLVAINKPSNLLVHRSNIDRHETQFALQLLRDQLGQHVFPVHRLDKPTSGVLIFALNSDIARQLCEAFANSGIEKTYWAIVRGLAPENITVDHPLKPKFDKYNNRPKQQDKPAQTAITHIKRLNSIELPYSVDRYPQSRYSLIEAKPVTGRKHQIRRHLKHISHPIIGDVKHGKGTHNRFFKDHFNCDRLLLTCQQISFQHPITQNKITIQSHLDESFKALLLAFNW
jgi:tRNA pseudouridine65 synthase